jgi:hypothetical protein
MGIPGRDVARRPLTVPALAPVERTSAANRQSEVGEVYLDILKPSFPVGFIPSSLRAHRQRVSKFREGCIANACTVFLVVSGSGCVLAQAEVEGSASFNNCLPWLRPS